MLFDPLCDHLDEQGVKYQVEQQGRVLSFESPSKIELSFNTEEDKNVAQEFIQKTKELIFS